MEMWTLTAGDLLPAYQVTLQDENAVAIDNTLIATAVLVLKGALGGTVRNFPLTRHLTLAGTWTYAWVTGDTDNAGQYYGQVKVIRTDGKPEHFPNGNERFLVSISPAVG